MLAPHEASSSTSASPPRLVISALSDKREPLARGVPVGAGAQAMVEVTQPLLGARTDEHERGVRVHNVGDRDHVRAPVVPGGYRDPAEMRELHAFEAQQLVKAVWVTF